MISHFPFDSNRLRDLSSSPQHRPFKANIVQLKKQVEESPDDILALRSLAILSFVAEQYRTSYECYVQLETILPQNPEVFCGLARLFMHGGEESLAVMYYIKTMEVDETFFTAYEELGDYYLLHEQYAQANYFYEKMLIDEVASGSGYFGLGLVAMAQKQDEVAVDAFQKSLDREYSSDSCCHQLGVLAAQAEEWEKALDLFRQELVINPNSYQAHFAMGRVFEEMDKPDKALAHYMETIKLEPELPEVYNNIATLYYNFKGDVEQALRNLELALDQDPTVEIKMRVYINLYRMHREEGNYDKSAYYYQLYADASGFLEN